MAKFRLRNLITKIPILDQFRLTFLSDCIYFALSRMDRSYDVTRVFPDSVKPFIEGDQQCIFAIYHGRMVGLLQLAPRDKYCILMSQSRDGEIACRGVNKMGLQSIRGSSARGAVQATKQMLRAAKKGFSLVVTVDGPRGPLHDLKTSTIRLAEMTGLPIVPSVTSSRNYTKMWGWDEFNLSHQGSGLAMLFAEPVYVPRGLSDEERETYRAQMDKDMTHLRLCSEEYWTATNQKQEIHC